MIRGRRMPAAHHAVWCLAAVILFLTCFAVYPLSDARVRERADTAADIGDRLRQNEAALERVPRDERRLVALRRELRELDVAADPPLLVARFVAGAAHAAAAHAVRLEALSAGRAPSPSLGRAHPVSGPIALDLSMQGSYMNLFRTMHALAETGVVADFDISSLERAPAQRTGANALTARLHAVLQQADDLAALSSLPGGNSNADTRRP